MIRTASNAWFPQVVSVLSLPDRGSEVDQVVEVLWDRLQIVKDANALAVMKNFPDVANSLAPFSDQEVLDAIAARISGGAAGDRPIKHAELDALLAVPEGYGDDAPIHPDFHARRLPESVWRHSARLDSIEAIIQVHRLREVLALAGRPRAERRNRMTRFLGCIEAVNPKVNAIITLHPEAAFEGARAADASLAR